MIAAPTFVSLQEYMAHRDDIDFWSPCVAEILKRHDLSGAKREPVAGYNATHPTFVCGDVVVKLFGYAPHSWRTCHASECAALALIASDPEIAAPRLLGAGQLYDDHAAPWPYLITTRMAGIPSWRAKLTAEQQLALAAELGKQVRRIHDLRPSGVARHVDWSSVNITWAARQSSLPSHLIAQIDDYLARIKPFDQVFVHGDLVENHVYVEKGRFVGIIDWGDAIVTDRHFEIIQLYRDMFRCDKTRLQVFLQAYDWPVSGDFARQALGLALHRQAVGMSQHNSIDVFEPIAAQFPLTDIATLDEMAHLLFDVEGTAKGADLN